jgi:AbrB family looped-hinge helix DNA binding protein
LHGTGGCMTTTIKLGKAGRIVVPVAVRERLRLREGSKLTIRCAGGSFSCAPERPEDKLKSSRRVRGGPALAGRDVAVPPGNEATGGTPEVRMKMAADGLPVIAGGKGFEAGKAVKAARQEAEGRLLRRLGR